MHLYKGLKHACAFDDWWSRPRSVAPFVRLALLLVRFEFCEHFFNAHADEAIEDQPTVRTWGVPRAPTARAGLAVDQMGAETLYATDRPWISD